MGMPAMALPPAAQSGPVAPVGTPPVGALAQPPVAPVIAPIIARPTAPPATPAPANVAPRPLPGADTLADAAKRVAAAGMLATQQAAEARGLDARAVEYEAIARLSRQVIEEICWEIIPELAEQIIRENLDKLARK
jgi:hypothetical protein